MSTFKGKRVAVLGGTGFLGSHLCERILKDGAASVVAVDNNLTGRDANVEHLRGNPAFGTLHHDITSPIPVEGALDYVLNFASPASPIDYHELPIETLRVGSLGTENGLRLAEKSKAVFVQASTSEIYGDPLVHPQHEGYLGNVDSTGPRAVYDEAKRYAEALVCAFRRSRGASVRIVRIFNTYGPRMRLDDGRVVPAFIAQALNGADFTVFGDGKQTRSFCYVDDLVDGILRLSLSDFQDPVNLGNPREMTVLEFAEAVRKVAGGGGKIVHKPFPQGDPKQRQPDIGRAKKVLGWEPKVGLEEGLKRTIEYFRGIAGRARAS